MFRVIPSPSRYRCDVAHTEASAWGSDAWTPETDKSDENLRSTNSRDGLWAAERVASSILGVFGLTLGAAGGVSTGHVVYYIIGALAPVLAWAWVSLRDPDSWFRCRVLRRETPMDFDDGS